MNFHYSIYIIITCYSYVWGGFDDKLIQRQESNKYIMHYKHRMKIVYSFKATGSPFICFEILVGKIEIAEHPCIPETIVRQKYITNKFRTPLDCLYQTVLHQKEFTALG